jgi:integrase
MKSPVRQDISGQTWILYERKPGARPAKKHVRLGASRLRIFNRSGSSIQSRVDALNEPAPDAILPLAIPDQRRRSCMSRRSGQNGRIEKKGKAFYARFWLDVPGQPKRTYKSVRICPVSGPGSLNKFEQKRRLKEIIAEFGANSEATLREAEAVNLGTTFTGQAERWLKEVQIRKRRPIKPHTASTWASYLKYLVSQLGEIPLCSVNNIAVKELIATMAADDNRFSPKSISNYVQVVKMVVASAIDKNGEQIYPVKWNHDFMDLPEVTDQRTPSFTPAEIHAILSEAKGQYQILYAALAGTGLRAGEALALQVEDVQDTAIRVRHSLWNGALHSPKTKNGLRYVDIHSSLAEALRAHIAGRSSGFVFTNDSGGSLHQSNVLRRSLHKILVGMGREKCGFHSFRRYRVTWLRKQRVPEDLLRFWIGHADKSITDGYSKVKEDVEYRRVTAEQAGLGFHVPTVVAELPVAPIAPKTEVGNFSASA